MKSFDHYFNHPRIGALTLRWGLAILMLFHGWFKLQNGVSGVEGMLSKAGLPAFLSLGVYIGEVVAPVMLLAGIFVAPAALVIAFNMVVAVFLAHMPQVLTLNAKTGGLALELQAFFFITAIVVALQAHSTKQVSAVSSR